jgi:dinuclear metal center YbgI/SA1388 family protein
MPSLGRVVDLLHAWYPPATADAWDAVGLVHGDPDAPVRRVLFAVDPVGPVAQEAVDWGADLLVVHHPLFLTPVHGFPATTPKGRTLSTLAAGGCALLTAHTNADQARSGVSEALASAVGVTGLEPLVPAPTTPLDAIVVFVPPEHADGVREAITDAGGGRLGDYESCTFTTVGEGRFRPLEGATPHIGEVGRPEVVAEERIEAVLPRSRRSAVVRAALSAHPYEEPAWDLFELADAGVADTGTGRVGEVVPTSLRGFAEQVATALPATAHGVRVAGDPDRPVRRVAVVGGAGDFLLDQVADSDADVYLTSDLRHHPASEFMEKRGPALVDVAHWAAEWTWLPVVADRLAAALAGESDATVDTRVSTLVTDAWTFRA